MGIGKYVLAGEARPVRCFVCNAVGAFTGMFGYGRKNPNGIYL